MKMKFYLIFPLFLVLFLGCGTKSIQMTVLRPAEVNLKNYHTIAVAQILNVKGRPAGHANDVAEKINEELVQSGRFDVVDRHHLKAVLKEQSLGASGLVDEGSASELGRLLGASVLIFGRIQEDSYKEEVSADEPYKTKKGQVKIRKHRRGTYSFRVSLKLIDVQKGKILTVKQFSAQKTAHQGAMNKTPPKIDRAPLYRQCLETVGKQFIKVVAPYKQRVSARFETDDLLPEVEGALSFFNAGEWSDGLQLLESATRKPGLNSEVKAKAFYNLGLAQIYNRQFDVAIKNIKQAIRLNPESSRYPETLKRAKAEKRKAEELNRQL